MMFVGAVITAQSFAFPEPLNARMRIRWFLAFTRLKTLEQKYSRIHIYVKSADVQVWQRMEDGIAGCVGIIYAINVAINNNRYIASIIILTINYLKVTSVMNALIG